MLTNFLSNSSRIKLNWLSKILHGQKLYLSGLILLNIVLGCIFSINALLLKDILNKASSHEYNSLTIYVYIFIFITLSQAILNSLNIALKSRIFLTFSTKLRHIFFSRILGFDYIYMKDFHTSSFFVKLTTDLNVITEGIMEFIPTSFNSLAQILSVGIVFFILSWKLAVLICIGGITILLINMLFEKKLIAMKIKNTESNNKLEEFFQETLSNFIIIKGMGLKKLVLKIANNITKNNRSNEIKRINYDLILDLFSQTLFKLFYISIILISLSNLLKGTFNLGTFTALILLSTRLQFPFSTFVKTFQKLSDIFRKLDALITMSNIKKEQVKESGNKFGHELSKEKSIANYNNSDIAINFSDVSFNYYNSNGNISKSIFKNTSFTLSKNRLYSITGKSGIGKTTFFYLLMYIIYKNHGFIKIGANNISLATRYLFAYVPQNNCLFSGTIRETLSFFNEKVTEEEIWKTLKICCADEFVENLPNKLDYYIGENGSLLSYGQCQRLAIARAIIADRPILLLDEACSGIDKKTELKILNNLKKLSENKTILIISHRNSCVDICDAEIQIANEKIHVKEKIINNDNL